MIFQAKKHLNWFKVVNVEAVQRYLDTLAPDEVLEVEIRKPKVRRNNSQNALIHALFMELDKLMHNDDPLKTKWQVLIEIGFYQEIEIKGRLEKLPLSTSKLDKKEFAELVDRIIRWAWSFHQWDIRPEEQRTY